MNARTAKRLAHLVVARMLSGTERVSLEIKGLRLTGPDENQARRAIKTAVDEIQSFHATLSRTEARR
jgi:hypothetical protein